MSKVRSNVVLVETAAGKKLIGLTSWGLNFTNSLQEETTMDSEGWAEYGYGKKGLTIPVSGLYDPDAVVETEQSADDLLKALNQGTKLTCAIKNGATTLIEGTFLVGDFKLDGKAEENVSVSGTLTLSGKPTTNYWDS